MTAHTILSDSAIAKSKVTTYKLDNGMDVVVIPDKRAPVVTHMVWYRVGAADEPLGQSGIAHFLEHLMFKGTEKISSGEFSKIIARNGGRDNAFTGQDVTAYFQRVAKDRLELVMQMEADRMVNLRLDEKDVTTERKVVLEERRSRVDNNPSNILGEQLQAAFYQAHPYGIPIIGWEHEIKKLNRQSALDFYKMFYAPNNAILVVAGDVEAQDVLELAKKTYGKNSAIEDINKRKRVTEPPHQAQRSVLLKDKRVGQASIQRIYKTPSYTTAKPGEAEALDLLMKIAASGPTSRLYKHMVVDKKVASSVSGWYAGSALDTGRIGLYAVGGSTQEDIQKMEAAINIVLAEIIEKGVNQEELDRARNVYLASYIYGSDSQSSLARRYGWGLASGRSIEDIEQWPERLKKVTIENIQDVARQYFNIKNSVTGILLPEPKQEDRADADKASEAEQPQKSKL
ncbi:MAG: pitrilysin family protein [Pseudomonadota bacterium]